jgi:hypothetical protein
MLPQARYGLLSLEAEEKEDMPHKIQKVVPEAEEQEDFRIFPVFRLLPEIMLLLSVMAVRVTEAVRVLTGEIHLHLVILRRAAAEAEIMVLPVIQEAPEAEAEVREKAAEAVQEDREMPEAAETILMAAQLIVPEAEEEQVNQDFPVVPEAAVTVDQDQFQTLPGAMLPMPEAEEEQRIRQEAEIMQKQVEQAVVVMEL